VTETRQRTLYGRRRGKKLRAGQEGLLETLLPKLLIAVPPEPQKIDLASLFGDARKEIWLEVGFGAGEQLVWQAEHHPEVGLLGCEPFINGVAKCLAHIERSGVSNIRLFTDDARLVMAALPDRSLSRAFILFPDPWPKTRHHKRRLVDARFAALAARQLAPGGTWRLATDWADYAEQMAEVLDAEAELSGGVVERWSERPVTKFERKGIEAGRAITDLCYIRA
jgi:tRNA (guanine-N7-)-methyltransferase